MSVTYDPFDPAVMADPLPYHRELRDSSPVYYLEKWDTYALSRFDDVWNVLEINDGTFVASEGTLPAAAVLAAHNDGPVIVDVRVKEDECCFPIVRPGGALDDILEAE